MSTDGPGSAGTGVSAQMPSRAGVFTRASSGLVRQVRTDDVMYYGWQQIALSYIIFIVLAWGAYPGASMELAALLAVFGGIAMGVCYALLASVYPRSGGEYVFISRVVHPAAGFAVSVSFAFWQIFYFGINGGFVMLFAVAPFLATLGVQTGSGTLVNWSGTLSGGWGMFIGGGLMILFHAYVQYRGAGLWFRWQRWASYIAVVSLAVTVVVLVMATAGVFDFRENFNELAGAGAYQQIAATASVEGFDLGGTLRYMLWPAFSIWFAVAAVSFSGEIKNVQRGQLIGINGAMVTMGIAMILLMAFSRGAFGDAFLLGASAEPPEYTLGAPPFISVFTGIATGSVLLTVVTFLWVLLIAFFVGGTTLIYSTRAMLAWSIDGVAPERLGDVTERYRSPHWAILVSTVGALIWLYLFAFTTLLGPISGFLGLAISFVAVSLTAVVFPFVKRDVFQSSPIAWRVGGIPLISLIGVISSVFVLWVFARLTVDQTFTLNLGFANTVPAIVVAAALVWFYVARAVRKRQGVELDRRYEEIPVE